MLINEKNLYNIDDDNVNIFIIKNDIEDVINKILFIVSVFHNVANCF